MHFWQILQNIWMKLTPQKLEGWGTRCGENCIILNLTVSE